MTAGIDNIGAMIRDERLRRGMTQEELGELVGVGKAQISKIESGKGLTIKTVTKVLGALGLSASVSLKSEQRIGRRVVGYIVAAINEFAAAHRMTMREAGNYLLRYKGIDFLAEHYEAEHLLSLDDSVQDLTRVCINNGGGAEVDKSLNEHTKSQFQYLVEGITKDIVCFLMEEEGYELTEALGVFYNSETFAKLTDEETGLYIESSSFVYEILKSELKYGKIQ
jgi:transcriptional regulator with XRE-family HTH domain